MKEDITQSTESYSAEMRMKSTDAKSNSMNLQAMNTEIIYNDSAEDTKFLNKNKPWRLVIRRTVSDGRSAD